MGEDALQQNYAKKSLNLNWAAWQKEIPYFSAWGSHRSEELQGTILSSQDYIYIYLMLNHHYEDQQLLHQLFVINLFLLSLFANQLKIKGSKPERQVNLNTLRLSRGF